MSQDNAFTFVALRGPEMRPPPSREPPIPGIPIPPDSSVPIPIGFGGDSFLERVRTQAKSGEE